jgi:hypothetical protein
VNIFTINNEPVCNALKESKISLDSSDACIYKHGENESIMKIVTKIERAAQKKFNDIKKKNAADWTDKDKIFLKNEYELRTLKKFEGDNKVFQSLETLPPSDILNNKIFLICQIDQKLNEAEEGNISVLKKYGIVSKIETYARYFKALNGQIKKVKQIEDQQKANIDILEEVSQKENEIKEIKKNQLFMNVDVNNLVEDNYRYNEDDVVQSVKENNLERIFLESYKEIEDKIELLINLRNKLKKQDQPKKITNDTIITKLNQVHDSYRDVLTAKTIVENFRTRDDNFKKLVELYEKNYGIAQIPNLEFEKYVHAGQTLNLYKNSSLYKLLVTYKETIAIFFAPKYSALVKRQEPAKLMNILENLIKRSRHVKNVYHTLQISDAQDINS